jgi:hypothetical protein
VKDFNQLTERDKQKLFLLSLHMYLYLWWCELFELLNWTITALLASDILNFNGAIVHLLKFRMSEASKACRQLVKHISS